MLNSGEFTAAYNYGLPQPFENIYNEAENLNSVVKSFKVDGDTDWTETSSKQYSPVQLFNPENKHLENYTSHSIQTKNGKMFDVKYTDVKPASNNIIGSLIGGKTIDAKTFYDKLGLDNFNNIAIIVDAASIALYDILSKGPELPGKNIFYIFGPEVVNDPATKKLPQDKVFINNRKTSPTKKNGVIIHSCVPVSLINSYNYHYDLSKGLKSTSYLDLFYSNYNFDLSEIKTNIKGKSVSYTTNLDIKGNKKEINTVVDSGEKNKITFIEKVVSKFLKLIKTSDKKKNKTSNRINDEEKFLFSSRLQQKRSGDWLQVLLCSSVKDKLRSFQEYDSESNNIVSNLDNVFLVTHDQIALSFALLNGINCIFTHHNSKHHFHAAMTFIAPNPEGVASQQKEQAKKCRDNRSYLQNDINKLINDIQEYTNTTYQNTTNKIKIDLLESIQKIIDGVDLKFSNVNKKNTPYNTSVFSINTRVFFTQSLKLIFSKSTCPDLQEQIIELNKIADLLVNLDDENDLVVINNYNIMRSGIDNVQSILKKVNSITYEDYLKQMNNFTKSHIYKTADKWNWNVNLSSRELLLYSDHSNKSIYGEDRNIFLYNLNNLDDDIKQKLSFIYYKEYQGLFNLFNALEPPLDSFVNGYDNRNRPIQMTRRVYDKFKSISLAFCIEVLLTIGGDAGVIGTSSTNNPSHLDITKLMDNFLVTIPQRFNLINDALVVQEDNNYNLSPVTELESITSELPNDRVNPNTNVVNEQGSSSQEKESQQYLSVTRFETSPKQVTKPLMSFILFGPYPQKLRDYILNKKTTTNTDGANAASSTLPEKKQRTSGGAMTDDTIDIFSDSRLCFHPLLPIYILTQSYISSIQNEDIETSLDCDLFVNYFDFLKKIKELVVNIYLGENNNNEKKIQAYEIGVGLKQLFFVENNNFVSYQTCINILNTNDEIFSKVSSYTETLVDNICGKIMFEDQELQNSSNYLNSELFTEFAHSIDLDGIFSAVPDYNSFDKNIFREKVLQFSSEVAKQIITDRGMEYSGSRTSTMSQGVARGVKRTSPLSQQPMSSFHRQTNMDTTDMATTDVDTTYGIMGDSWTNKNIISQAVPVSGGRKIKLTRRTKHVVKKKTRRNVKKNNKSQKKIKKNKKTRKNKKK